MSTTATRAQQFREFAERGDHQGFEDLWLERLDAAPAEVDPFIQGGDALASQGQFDKAGLYLSMLSPVLLERELYLEALQVLRKMAEVAPRERGLRHGLLTAYRGLYGDDPNLETFLEMCGVADGKDPKAAVQKMDTFLHMKTGAYLFHPGGWHAGRIAEVDADDASLVIDFAEKRGHRMSMEMAAKKTDLIADNDLRAMKLDRLEEVKRLIEEDPVELIRCGLRSRRGKASLRDLRDRIAGDVIPTKSWSRWWQKARGKVKAAGDITITPGANPTIELGEESGGYTEACLRDLRHLPTDTRRVRYFRDLMKEAPAHEDGIPALVAVATNLISASPDMGMADRISLSFLLTEATQKWSEITSPDELAPAHTLLDHDSAIRSLARIPISSHRVAAMLEIKQHEGIDWPALCRQVIVGGAPESAEHCLADLLRGGHEQVAEDAINAVADRYRDHPRAFIWYVRSARGDKLPANIRRDRDTVLLEKSLVLHSHLDKEAIRLKDLESIASGESKDLAATLAKVFPLKDYALVRDAFREANESEATTLAALLRNNRSLNADLRDRMMAHMFRTRPEAAKFDTGAPVAPTNPMFDPGIIYTTEKALQARRVEHEDVVNTQIPDNSIEIGRAASHGDLSENAEWTAAVEKQERLTKLAEELADGIQKARIISGDIQQESEGNVTLGSRVSLTDAGGAHHAYTVLGPWDVDAGRGFISYLSPIGRALIGHTKGETVGLDVAAGHVEFTITSIADGFADSEG
ncbi:MAG: GreA/GreB family elongation factor [Planctomycetes bacterium]|nr:GreA/GreB family elongation factor [Planctomycetota bacterium]